MLRSIRLQWMTSLVALLAASWLTSSALAQLRPSASEAPLAGGAGADLRREAGPGAHFVRDGGGRVRIARGMRLRVSGDSPVARARAFLDRFAGTFGLRGLDLREERAVRAGGFTVTRFRRFAGGRPVLLRSVAVREALDGAIDMVIADPGPARVDGSAPSVGVDAVKSDALSRMQAWRARVVEVRPVGLPLSGAVRPGFVLLVGGQARGQRARLVYDGAGRLLVAASAAPDALGRVYDPNPPNAMEMTSDVELPNLTAADRLDGRYVRAFTCGTAGSRCAPTQSAVADAAGDFLYDPVEPSFSDPFSEVSGYFHADRVAGYFHDVHGFVWSCCGDVVPLDVVVNYSDRPGTPHDNAAYAPSSCSGDECGTILLGQGMLRDFAYDGDVVYHEFTHSVVDQLAGIVGFDFDRLGISYEPAGINEGTADYFSAAISGDPAVAEYFTGAGGIGGPGSLRNLDNDLVCPQSLFGEGHLDGRVWGGAAWRVREAIGAERADALMYSTVAAMVDNTNFEDAAEILVGTAQAMVDAGDLEVGDLAAVEEAVDVTGIRGCRRIVPLDDEVQRTGYSGNALTTGSLGQSVAPLHYSIEIPADATRLTLHLSHLTSTGRYTYYFRDGREPYVDPARRPPLRADGMAPAEATVELTATSAHPLPRCETLYISLRAEDLNEAGESVYQISATLERSGDTTTPCPEPPPDPDAGPPPGPDAGVSVAGSSPGGGGCDCRAGARERPVVEPWHALLLLLLLGWRRGGSGRT